MLRRRRPNNSDYVTKINAFPIHRANCVNPVGADQRELLSRQDQGR